MQATLLIIALHSCPKLEGMFDGNNALCSERVMAAERLFSHPDMSRKTSESMKPV